MEIKIDENEIEGLWQEYMDCPADHSYWTHIANYLICELQNQYPNKFPEPKR